MRFREFSDPFDQAGQLPSVATCAVRRWVSIGCEPAPPHDVEPQSGRTTYLRLTKREAVRQRRDNEERWERLQRFFADLDLDPVLLTTADPVTILDTFIGWSEQRLYWRGRW